MIGEIIAMVGIGTLAVGPLVWRTLKDRRDEAALQVQAEVQATANRVFGGESLLTVTVTPPWLARAGQVRLSTPAGFECLIEAAWPKIMNKLPRRYELVVESRAHEMDDVAQRARTVGAAA
jgi:hypothetical protein